MRAAVPKEVAETPQEERYDKIIVDRVLFPAHSHPQDREEIKGVHADAVPKEVAETFLEERCDKVIVSIESHVLPIATRRIAKRSRACTQMLCRRRLPRPFWRSDVIRS